MNIKLMITKTIFKIIVISLVFVQNIKADDWDEIVNLRGYWKFNIGNDQQWSNYEYNDENWEEIRVPSSWEDEGYFSYNGYAWYRYHFDFPPNIQNQVVYLSLGYIDDVDEVYLNGRLVGSTGSFPPNYGTAYNALRKYPVPLEYFYSDKKNILAVKVYDSRMAGGIVAGDISIMAQNTLELKINLEGFWKFKVGDNLEWKESEYDDFDWESIIVPSKWEIAGYPDYNGYAWYRINFNLSKSMVGDKLVLLLGKIDDIDQCYLNGELIGSTGNFNITPKTNRFDNEWQELRGYYIPDNLIKYGDNKNTIAVRVYDGYLDGGIYHGPIGITTQKEYRDYWKEKKQKKGFWDYIFD